MWWCVDVTAAGLGIWLASLLVGPARLVLQFSWRSSASTPPSSCPRVRCRHDANRCNNCCSSTHAAAACVPNLGLLSSICISPRWPASRRASVVGRPTASRRPLPAISSWPAGLGGTAAGAGLFSASGSAGLRHLSCVLLSGSWAWPGRAGCVFQCGFILLARPLIVFGRQNSHVHVRTTRGRPPGRRQSCPDICTQAGKDCPASTWRTLMSPRQLNTTFLLTAAATARCQFIAFVTAIRDISIVKYPVQAMVIRRARSPAPQHVAEVRLDTPVGNTLRPHMHLDCDECLC